MLYHYAWERSRLVGLHQLRKNPAKTPWIVTLYLILLKNPAGEAMAESLNSKLCATQQGRCPRMFVLTDLHYHEAYATTTITTKMPSTVGTGKQMIPHE
jgi:hypothetical protein